MTMGGRWAGSNSDNSARSRRQFAGGSSRPRLPPACEKLWQGNPAEAPTAESIPNHADFECFFDQIDGWKRCLNAAQADSSLSLAQLISKPLRIVGESTHSAEKAADCSFRASHIHRSLALLALKMLAIGASATNYPPKEPTKSEDDCPRLNQAGTLPARPTAAPS